MALSTSRVCLPHVDGCLCSRRKVVCPGGCKPGFCLNAQCVYHSRPEIVYCNPELEHETDSYRQRIGGAIKEQKRLERQAFLASEKKKMGITEPEERKRFPSWYKTEDANTEPVTAGAGGDGAGAGGGAGAAVAPGSMVNICHLKVGGGPRTLRPRARPSCQLAVADILLPSDDMSQLSDLLRTSTTRGYSSSHTISQYQDTHNMAVWNNRTDVAGHIHKLKRDWLSIWGERNITDQRWRKAWLDKFSGDSLKK